MITSNGHVLDESPRRLGELEAVPDHERHDRDALWARLRRDGYLFLRGHLDPEVAREFRRYYFDAMKEAGFLDRASAAEVGRDSTGDLDRARFREVLFGEIVPGDTYAALAEHPAIRDWFAWFLDDEVHLHKRRIIRQTRPGEAGIGTATQAHYDLVYLREGSDRVLSIWVPLGRVDQEVPLLGG